MKSEPALDPPHQLAPKTETRFGARREVGSEDFSPRFVETPSRRQAVQAGRRNLFWGSALLVAALVLLVLGVLISGPRAVLWPSVALITFASLWVLARMRIFRQRNGVFFGVALVALLGSILALGESSFMTLRGSRTLLPFSGQSGLETGVNPAVISPENPPGAEPLPLLSEALNLTPPDPAEGSRVKVLQNAEVKIGGKSYRVLAGEMFPFEEAKAGEVTFSAGEFRAKLPTEGVQILGPQRVQPEPGRKTPRRDTRDARTPAVPADPAHVEIERRARAEAIRRFPALADKKSPENQEFVRTYNEMKQRNAFMLEDPEWPIRLAEFLAKELKWKEADDTDSEPPKTPGRGVIEEP